LSENPRLFWDHTIILIHTIFCPCIRNIETWHTVDICEKIWNYKFCICCLSVLFSDLIICIVGPLFRGFLKQALGAQRNTIRTVCLDFMIWILCTPCAITQEARQIDKIVNVTRTIEFKLVQYSGSSLLTYSEEFGAGVLGQSIKIKTTKKTGTSRKTKTRPQEAKVRGKLNVCPATIRTNNLPSNDPKVRSPSSKNINVPKSDKNLSTPSSNVPKSDKILSTPSDKDPKSSFTITTTANTALLRNPKSSFTITDTAKTAPVKDFKSDKITRTTPLKDFKSSVLDKNGKTVRGRKTTPNASAKPPVASTTLRVYKNIPSRTEA